jgi:hypothetical protein
VSDATVKAKAEAARNEPSGCSFMVQSAAGQNIQFPWAEFLVVSLKLELALFFFKPIFGISFWISVIPAALGIKHKEAPVLVVIFVVFFVNLARCKVGLTLLIVVPYRVVFLATLTTKM